MDDVASPDIAWPVRPGDDGEQPLSDYNDLSWEPVQEDPFHTPADTGEAP